MLLEFIWSIIYLFTPYLALYQLQGIFQYFFFISGAAVEWLEYLTQVWQVTGYMCERIKILTYHPILGLKRSPRPVTYSITKELSYIRETAIILYPSFISLRAYIIQNYYLKAYSSKRVHVHKTAIKQLLIQEYQFKEGLAIC